MIVTLKSAAISRAAKQHREIVRNVKGAKVYQSTWFTWAMNCLAFGHMNSTLHHIPNPARASDERWNAISYYELSGRNQHKLLFTCFLSRKWSVGWLGKENYWIKPVLRTTRTVPVTRDCIRVGMAFGVRWIYVCKYLLNWCTWWVGRNCR